MDLKTGENSRWSGRFLWNKRKGTGGIFSNPIDTFNVANPLTSLSQNVTNTRNFGPNVVNEFGLHWYRRPYFSGRNG